MCTSGFLFEYLHHLCAKSNRENSFIHLFRTKRIAKYSHSKNIYIWSIIQYIYTPFQSENYIPYIWSASAHIMPSEMWVCAVDFFFVSLFYRLWQYHCELVCFSHRSHRLIWDCCWEYSMFEDRYEKKTAKPGFTILAFGIRWLTMARAARPDPTDLFVVFLSLSR